MITNAMRILLLNPNMSQSMTDTMAVVANQVASEGVEIDPVTATRGFPYISTRAESQITGALVLEMIAEKEKEVDGVVIAAFGDPGLKAAREIFSLPVVGMAEASMVTAGLLGERFSIVTFSPVMSRWYLDSVSDSGLSHRFVGIRTPANNEIGAFDSQDAMAEELLRLVMLCVEEDGADVVILGGAPLAGMATRLQENVPALLLDPVSCAVATVESLAKVTVKSAFQRRLSRPAAKSSVGLSAALAQTIDRGEL